MPQFTVDPSPICEVTYSVVIKDPLGNIYACSNCFDPSTQVFSFHYDNDLLLSGHVSQDYTVEVTGTSGYLTPKEATTNFNLEVLNPCIDPAFVSIVQKPLIE